VRAVETTTATSLNLVIAFGDDPEAASKSLKTTRRRARVAHPLAVALREGREETGLPDLAPLVPDPLHVVIVPVPARGAEPAHEHADIKWIANRRRLQQVIADIEKSPDRPQRSSSNCHSTTRCQTRLDGDPSPINGPRPIFPGEVA
jgi:hypothetical protein